MKILLSKESIDEAKKRIRDDPFVFKIDFLKFIKEEEPALLLWAANYSKSKFNNDKDANHWFSFALSLIFASFDFEIHMYKKLTRIEITKNVIDIATQTFKTWDDLKNFYKNLSEKEPFLFNFSESLREVAKKMQNENRDNIKHEDVFMAGICYFYKMFEVVTIENEINPRIFKK